MSRIYHNIGSWYAVKRHSADVSFKPMTPAHCVEWQTGAALRRTAWFCVNDIKLTKGGLLASLQRSADEVSLCKNGLCVYVCVCVCNMWEIKAITAEAISQ